MAKTKQIVELRDPALSAGTKLEPKFDWFVYPALVWAFYTLGSESFAQKMSSVIDEVTKPDDLVVLFGLSPAAWFMKNLAELQREGGG